MYDITILDNRLKRITISKPVIRVRIGKGFLTKVTRGIYSVNVKKLHKELDEQLAHMFEDREHVRNYYPVGQVKCKGDVVDTLLVNSRIVPLSNKYTEIKPNIWYASLKNAKSLGTIYSTSMPSTFTPVFPAKYMTKVNNSVNSSYNKHVSLCYSDPMYGNYTINFTAINFDRSTQMIGTDGTIQPMKGVNPMYVPGLNAIEHVFGMYDGKNEYTHRAYYNTQGKINTDGDCVKPQNNRSNMHINECNGYILDMQSDEFNSLAVVDNSTYETFSDDISTSDTSSSDSDISSVSSVSSVSNDSSDYSEYSTNSTIDTNSNLPIESEPKNIIMKGDGCVLKTKSNPWFMNGEMQGINDSHKVTHQSENLLLTSKEIRDILSSNNVDILKNKDDKLLIIGKFDILEKDNLVTNITDDKMVYDGNVCNVGYSMHDRLMKCNDNVHNIHNTHNTHNSYNGSVEGFSESYDYNNMILLIIAILVLCLLAYKYY